MSGLDLTSRVLYLIGSVVFLTIALVRGHPLIAAGSAMFLAGTLLVVVDELRQLRRRRSAARQT